MKKITVVLSNEEGLHARPANIFSRIASQFESDIVIYKNDNKNKEYNPKSILSLMSMGAAMNDKITIVAEGEDEEKAVNDLQELIESGFSEKEE
ncbi:MAG: HPr family phosphocarrier protein [Firmicutes bacterium]|nr:HPr family phosphocarrier protein [Bacillota bacterium]